MLRRHMLCNMDHIMEKSECYEWNIDFINKVLLSLSIGFNRVLRILFSKSCDIVSSLGLLLLILLRQDDPLNNIFGGQTIFLCVNYAQICVNGNC